jgi:CBS domain containing-hemolysin-like protein
MEEISLVRLAGSWPVAIAFSGRDWAEVIAVVFSLVLLAYISLAEAAILGAGQSRLRHLAEKGERGAELAAKLAEDRLQLVGTFVIALNLSVVSASFFVTSLTYRHSGGSAAAIAFASAAMILLILVCCELAPKSYGVSAPERTARRLAPSLALLHRGLRPFSHLLNGFAELAAARVLIPLFGGETRPRLALSEDELVHLLEASEAQGELEEGAKEMIHGAIEFADKVAREVMVARTDMACLPVTAPLAEAVEMSLRTGFSRIPVYEQSVDDVVGVLYVKDIISRLAEGKPAATAGELARRPAFAVPESKPIDDLLRQMQRQRVHLAIVIDEYGGTSGLVTIEDLLEEIVGEIREEHDREAEPILRLGEETVLVDARLSVEQLGEEFDLELPEGDYDSVGGLLLQLFGRVPRVGEKTECAGLEFVVEAVGRHRIRRVRVTRQEAPDEEAEASPETD